MLRMFLTATVVLVSTAASADYKTDCLDGKDHDLRIKGCSAMIQHNPKDELAYYNRGDAYGLKREADRPSSDYNKAIELNPDCGRLHGSRSRFHEQRRLHPRGC